MHRERSEEGRETLDGTLDSSLELFIAWFLSIPKTSATFVLLSAKSCASSFRFVLQCEKCEKLKEKKCRKHFMLTKYIFAPFISLFFLAFAFSDVLSLEAFYNGIRSFAYALNMRERERVSAICIKCVYHFNGYCIIYWSFFVFLRCFALFTFLGVHWNKDAIKSPKRKRHFNSTIVPAFFVPFFLSFSPSLFLSLNSCILFSLDLFFFSNKDSFVIIRNVYHIWSDFW